MGIVRFLLLLSAFLTALVGTGATAPAVARPAYEMSASASVRAEHAVARVAAFAPRKFGALDRVNFGPVAVVSGPVRAVPLYANRLRV